MTEPRNGSTDGSSDGPGPDGYAQGGPAGGGTATAAPPAAPDAAPDAAPPKRRMKRSTRIALLVVVVLAVLAGAAFGLYYVLDTRHYVSTDGSKIDINAPTSGTLIDWEATQGAELSDNEVVGRIRVDGGFVQPQRSIRAPADATVAVDNGVPGSYVTAGTNLATAYDLSQVYVTARVDETDVDDIRAGQRVQFTVDAFPDADFTGVNTRSYPATARRSRRASCASIVDRTTGDGS